MTTPSEIAVFWTTESIVIGPVETGAWVGRSLPGVPTPHWEGSAPWPGVREAVAPARLNSSERRNTGLLLCMVSSLEADGGPRLL